jgi:hypothetical protein
MGTLFSYRSTPLTVAPSGLLDLPRRNDKATTATSALMTTRLGAGT